MNALVETNEPEVTAETRFYLWFEATMYGPKPTPHWRHRINVVALALFGSAVSL